MVETYVNVNTVIAKILRDVGEQGNYRYSSIKEWIAEIVQKISYKHTMVRAYAQIEIKNYRATQPCNLLRTIALTYNGCKLRYGSDIRHHDSSRINNINKLQLEPITDVSRYFASNYDLFYKYDCDGKLISTISNNEVINNMYQVRTNQVPIDYYYYIEADWYKFNIEEGIIELDYMALYTDADGFPLIPDNTYLLEAIQYYVLMKLIGTGYTHPLWTGVNGYMQLKQLFEEAFGRAKGTIYYPSLDMMNAYTEAYNKLMPNFQELDRYKHNIEGNSNTPNPAL